MEMNEHEKRLKNLYNQFTKARNMGVKISGLFCFFLFGIIN